MTTGTEMPTEPLYKRLLGPKFEDLPDEIQAMHNLHGKMQAVGTAQIERGSNVFTRFIAALIGFPRSGADVPVAVTFTQTGEGEEWKRDFAGIILHTKQDLGRGKYAGYLIERFGPWSFILAVPSGPDGLRLEPRGMQFLGLPMPAFVWPRISAGESVVGGQFIFDVSLDLPFLGRLVHYRGTLCPI